MGGKDGKWELWVLKDVRAVWGEVLIPKISVEEMQISWKKFKRQYSVMAKSIYSGSRLLGFESLPPTQLASQIPYLLNGVIIVLRAWGCEDR